MERELTFHCFESGRWRLSEIRWIVGQADNDKNEYSRLGMPTGSTLVHPSNNFQKEMREESSKILPIAISGQPREKPLKLPGLDFNISA